MSEIALQGLLSDENEAQKTPTLDNISSQLYEKLNPVLQLFSDHPESTLRSEAFLDTILTQIRVAVNPDLLLLFRWDDAPQEWTLLSQHGLPEHLIKNGTLARAWQSLPTIVCHEIDPLFSSDISKDRRFIGQVVRGINIRTFFGITLRSEKKVYGSLSIGFYEPASLTHADQMAFLMMSNLLPPFLLQQPAPREAEIEPISLSLNLSGRIQNCNAAFLDLLDREREQVENASLSQFSTKTGYGTYLSAVKRVKAEEDGIPPFELEVAKKGGFKRLLLTRITLTKNEKNQTAIELTAKEITQIAPLEVALAYKNGLQSILTAISFALKHTSLVPLNEDQILKEALEKGFSQLGIDGGCFLRFRGEKKKLQMIANKGLSTQQESQIEKHGIGLKEPLLWKVIDSGSPILMAAKSDKSSLKKQLFGEGGLISFIGIPVESGGHLWGILVFFSRNQVYTGGDLKALATLGKEVGFAIDQMQSFISLQKRIETLETLNKVGRSITKSLHLEQLLSSIANNMKKIIDASNCYIFLEDGRRHLYFGAGASDGQTEAVRKFEIKTNEKQIVVLTAREHHPFVIENASHDSRVGKKWVRTFKSRSLISVPLVSKDRVSGVLLLDETRYFRKFTNEEVQKVAEMAEQISSGIENATLHHAVRRHRERLQTLSSAIVNIQEEERRRIAKKLRDEAGAALKTIQSDLDWIKQTLKNPTSEMEDRLDRVKIETGKTLETLTGLSSDLRPAALDESGLVSTIKSVVKEFEAQNNTKVHLQIAGTIKRLPARIEILLFRVIQEALANISTHSKAESAIISLEKREPYIHLYITDDGKGFDVRRYFASPQIVRKEIGILSMKERVELSGGTFYIDSHPGQGTRISIRIPVIRRNTSSQSSN